MEFAVYNAKFDAITKNVDWEHYKRVYTQPLAELERNLRIRYLARKGVTAHAIIEGIGWSQSEARLYKIIGLEYVWLEDIEARLGLLD